MQGLTKALRFIYRVEDCSCLSCLSRKRIGTAKNGSEKAVSTALNQAQLDRLVDNSLNDRDRMYVERVRLENMEIR